MKATDYWLSSLLFLFMLYVVLHMDPIIAFLDRLLAPVYPC